ncbi:unnamed protein product [Vitrella brassicaformis CCMP3155]|uniref:Exostosin GT47 domain-containing protein n=1 Tax=Vitrella brassicaformis (strain CCMP3155) TaxID=1169540 RepID=A0A0G4GVG1_VITBC|nr:unnamed protein product [Vitrella brassicaformis CCMP3155]|eukprot:CEM34877.1 unnamed protein product [Vitrella brassicaformis CCMP3155]
MLLLHLIHLPFSFSASVWPQTMDSAMDGNANFADLEALEPDVKVPFYIYQTPAMRKLYDGCQRTALSILDGRWPPHLPKGMGDVNRKNYDEVFWLDQLWNDSWRTFDPEDALVFVIPVYPVLSLEQACEGDRNQTHALAEAAIMQLPYFGRNEGLDHIVMGIDWRFTHTKNKSIKRAFGRRFAALAKKISWGRKVAERGYGHIGCAVTSPFTSVLTFLQKGNQPFEKESLLERGLIDARDVFEDNCIHTARNPPSKHDWFARDYSMFFQGQTSFRRGYIYRRLAFQHLVGWNFTAKGDDVTSSRYVDGFRSRTLNVLITEAEEMFKYAMPFQCEIPWRNFTFVIDGPLFKADPRKALTPILEEVYGDHAAIRERLRLMDYYSKKILWDAPGSTTARSVLRAMTRQCLTEKAKADFIRRTSKWKHGEWMRLCNAGGMHAILRYSRRIDK